MSQVGNGSVGLIAAQLVDNGGGCAWVVAVTMPGPSAVVAESSNLVLK